MLQTEQQETLPLLERLGLGSLDPWSLLVGGLTILFGVITLASFLLMIRYQRANRELYRQRYSYSWSDVHQGVRALLGYCRRRRFSPQAIVTFSGAAGVIANLFLLLTGRRLPFYQVMVTEVTKPWPEKPAAYTVVETARHTIFVPEALTGLDRGSRVLLIDAVCVTGTNADAVLSYLRSLGFQKLVYVSLLRVKPVNAESVRAQPSYFYFDNPSSEWYWPWGKGK